MIRVETNQNKMKKLIAYKTVDNEGDHWYETSFLFENQDKVREFFRPDNPEFARIFIEGDNEVLEDFEINDDNPAKNITSITFTTEYAGDVKIVEMSEGYFIQ